MKNASNNKSPPITDFSLSDTYIRGTEKMLRKIRNIARCTVSFLLISSMMIPTAYGNVWSSAQTGGSANGSSPLSNYSYNRNSQFFRISLFWSPQASSNVDIVDSSNVDWNASKMEQIGQTFDFALADGNNPYYIVTRHSNFKNAIEYFQKEYKDRDNLETQDYYSAGRVIGAKDNVYTDNEGNPMKIPRPVANASGTGNDVKHFFSQDTVLNDIAWNLKVMKGLVGNPNAYDIDRNLANLSADVIKSGLYESWTGEKLAGGYLLIVEPGAYTNTAYGYTATTLRDSLYTDNDIYRKAPAVLNWISQAVILEPNMDFSKQMGLSYVAGKDLGSKQMSTSLFQDARTGWGVGAFRFWSDVYQLPVINYFYDVQPNETVDQALQRIADTAKKVDVAGTNYTAPREIEGYTLYKGFVADRTANQGSLDIKVDGQLKFYNTSDEAKLSDVAVAKIGSTDSTAVKVWDKAEELVTTVDNNRARSGLSSEEKHLVNTGETLRVNYGNGAGSLQAVFLYVKNSELTNVTKLYYKLNKFEKKEVVPVLIPKLDTKADYDEVVAGGYIIDHEDPYKVTDWTFIEDKDKSRPEDVNSWEDALNKKDDNCLSGSTIGKLTSGWTNPDKELVIRYEREKDEGEPYEADLRLTEKRISWLKSLADIGGIPTIKFSWSAVTGHHTHIVGSGKHKRIVDCNESVLNSDLTFVSSNNLSVKSQIMGNAVGFMPYDTDNVYSFNRGNEGGEYLMRPNYHYTIWRGLDIPTIASYKYGDTEGTGKVTTTPLVSSLLGETTAGISPVKARHTNNHSFYTDDFMVLEGKADVDTGNMFNFMAHYKGDMANATQAFKQAVSLYETTFEDLENNAEAWKQAQIEWRNACYNWESIQEWYARIDWSELDWREESQAKRRYAEAQREYEKAQAVYEIERAKQEALEQAHSSAKEALFGDKEAVGGNIGDYRYSTRWGYCGRFGGWKSANGTTEQYNVNTRVDIEYGDENTGNDTVDFNSENLKAFGKEYKNVQGFAINNTAPIEFYPYVEMFYDTTIGLTEQTVNVLAGHKSTFLPRDYVEIGYITAGVNNETSTGLLMQSQQWSTHTRAIKLAKGAKNKVLPAGAIYRLSTPSNGANGNTRTRVAMSSWLTFLPADTINATVTGKDIYNGTAQNNRNEDLYRQVLKGLNSLDIVQVVDGGLNATTGVKGTQVLQELAGTQRVEGTTGQPTSKDTKYWLKQNIADGTDTDPTAVGSTATNEADLDIISTQEERIYYRVYSDVQGNVYVSKSLKGQADTMVGSGTILGKITKAQGLDDLLAQSTEIQALNNRTKVVENYLNAIDRNLGNDVSLSDPKWYNEAFDGICVVRVNKEIEIGFKDNDPNKAVRTSAIDPKLQTKRASQSGLFGTAIKSWFETDYHTNISNKKGHVGTFTTGAGEQVDIILKDMNKLYKSKEFLIPDVNVMNLY